MCLPVAGKLFLPKEGDSLILRGGVRGVSPRQRILPKARSKTVAYVRLPVLLCDYA